jgi:hypothetical protein
MDNLIYHFTGAEALKSIVLNQCFWITKSDYLNDTTEQVVIMELLKVFFKEHTKMDKDIQKYIREQLMKYLTQYNHYILSFSQSDDSLPLWNYYSENEGYSIGIDKTDFIRKLELYFCGMDSNAKVFITPIKYLETNGNEKAVNELLLPFIHFTSDDITNKKDSLDELALVLANMSYSIKHAAYLSEREERIVIICEKNSIISQSEEFRVLRGSFIPYIVYNKMNSPDLQIPIKKIKLSPYHTMDVTKKSVLHLLNRKYGEITEVDITQSLIPSRY